VDRLPDAVVFDFDGLIFDSETSIYEASAAALATFGHDMSIETWAKLIGIGGQESFARMTELLGAQIDQDAYKLAYATRERLLDGPALPGVVRLLEVLAGAGVPCGVASSSSAGWVPGHLARLGLSDCFATVATRDRVGGRSKPAPDSYLLACADLGAEPARSVALEDSAPGIAAALAAGMAVVAVPSHITAHTDLSAAHLTVSSLADVSLEELAHLSDPTHPARSV